MYRIDDLDLIKENLSRISDEAAQKYLDSYEEPTKEEYINVMKDIKSYIKEKDLIIYGGFAQNVLIGEKNREDQFYKATNRADVEVYTPDPIGDGIRIADMLHKKGYKMVQCKEGIHNETYKIFANLFNFADISYMDPNVFKNCPYIKVNGLKMAHPHFMFTDAYRVYADPMTSYFRLDKSFNRFTTLIKHYSFDEDAEFNKLTYKKTKENDEIRKFIRKKIIHNSNLVVIGHNAYNYLVKKLDKKHAINFNYIQIISSNFKCDSEKITKILKEKYGKKIYFKRYHPFFQFHGERIEYEYDGKVVLKLYDNNDRCIIYNFSEKKNSYFGAFSVVMLNLIADYNFHIVNENKEEEKNYLTMIVRLIKIRNEFLEKNKFTILDDSPFREFNVYKCFGKPLDPIRSSFLKGFDKIKKGKKAKFSYTPTGKPGKVPSFRFNDSSGKLKK